MEYRSKVIDIYGGMPSIVLNELDAESAGVRVHDRVKVSFSGKTVIALVKTTETYINRGEVGIFSEVKQRLNLKDGDLISITPTSPPESLNYIKKKMSGASLSKDEIFSIIKDVVGYNLSDVEIAAFMLCHHFQGMSMDEIEALTRALVETGEIIDFDQTVYDKHSVGGVPGNKVSLLIVPIISASNLLIPKTSSKAITSPSGTADTMSVLAPVEFSPQEFKQIALKAGGAIVWGGRLGLAPADDILIKKVEYPLELDPYSQMLASIMAKKMAVGTSCVVIDIPTGRGSKVADEKEARRLSADFMELGRRVGIRVVCGITYGGQPVGHTVGPALEAKEALETLMGKGPTSLVEKSTALAGLLLEAAGVAAPRLGQEYAKKVLESGKALEKMRQIIEAQGGDPNVKPEDLQVGQHKISIYSPCDGYVTEVDNSAISAIARMAGAPVDKGAGLVLYGKRGRYVKKDDVILEIYAERSTKLSEAYNLAVQKKPITIEGMLLHRVPDYT
ncbi:AMP phosphorylase [Candidatus Bathyarchaeota archaeon]|nr:AMP phosphorylase [Candidatus Bathyarchaeota archaeon]